LKIHERRALLIPNIVVDPTRLIILDTQL